MVGMQSEKGFSLLEIALVVAIMMIIIGVALPGALGARRDYRLHADAAAVASSLNLARMKAASQYAPYRLDVSPSGGTYALERLCGNTPASGAGGDANCTSAYKPFTTPIYDGSGTQYAAQGNTFLACLPSGLSTRPGTITADPDGCPSSPPDPLPLYFNTRGASVDGTGSPLSNGGIAVYINSPDNLVDAVAVSVGGRVTIWNWDVKAGQWYAR